MTTRTVLAGIATIAITQSISAQPIQWRIEDGGNGNWYEAVVVGTSTAWSDARDAAAARGGYLVSILSQEESDWLFDNLVSDDAVWYTNAFGDHVGPHIGLYQDPNHPDFSEPGGGWVWLSGEDLDFSSWEPGQPNNAGVGQHVAMYFTNRSAPMPVWGDGEDFSDNNPISYVVEYDTLGPTLIVSPLPLVATQPGRFEFSSGTPGDRVALLYSSSGSEPTYIPQLNVVVNLRQPQMAGSIKRADSEGAAVWQGEMPAVSQATPIWFQCVQYESVTNLVETEIVP